MPPVKARHPSHAPDTPTKPTAQADETTQQSQVQEVEEPGAGLGSPQEQEQDPYMSLAKQLAHDVAALHELYRQREKLRQEQAGLNSEKKRCGDLLFQLEEFNQTLEDDFTAILHKLDLAATTLDAANRKTDLEEQTLHAVLPLATQTFQRLYQELQTQTHEQDFQTLLSMLHQEAVQQFKAAQKQARLQEQANQNLYLPTPSPSFQSIPLEDKLKELAALCPASFNLRKLNIPNVPFFALQSSSDQAVSIQAGQTIIRKFSSEEIQQNRKKTMQQVIDCTNTLVDLAIQILDFSENIPGFTPPPFVLGPTSPEPQAAPAFEIVDQREETLKQTIRDQLELRRQLRLAQGRGDEPIQAFELDVIAHSLSLRTYGEKFSISKVKEMIRHLFPETQFQIQQEPLMRIGA